MRAIWNGFISFGLVTIPVSVGLAQQRKDVSFRTLSRATMRPVKQKRWDPEHDVEVGPDDTIKGWEVAKGQYVPVEEDELFKFAARQEKTIEIHQFVDVGEVDPVFFDRAYWLEPQERADRPYALLATALERSGRAALGRFVLSTKEHLVLIRALDGILALQTLYYSEDVRTSDRDDIAARIAGIEVGEQELAMADQLIQAGVKEFTPDALRNEARARLLDFLEAKAAGQEPVAAPDEPEPVQVVDLMEALKASLDAAGVDEAAGAAEEQPAGAS